MIWKQVEEVAENSNCKKRHVGCVITDENGVFISHGYNYHENDVCDCIPGPGTAVHAEIMAVNSIPIYHRNAGLEAYVNHEPCERCRSILDVVCNKVIVNPTSKRLEQTVGDTLKERGHTHGIFEESSEYVQRIKDTMRECTNWYELSEDKREALDMIQNKVGRVLHGDANFKDHWTDICGYAHLIEKEL